MTEVSAINRGDRQKTAHVKTLSLPNSGCAWQPLQLLMQNTGNAFISRIAEKSGQTCQHDTDAQCPALSGGSKVNHT